MQKLKIDIAQTVLSRFCRLIHKAIGFQRLQQALDCGRTESQMGAQLPHAPNRALGVEGQQHTQGFFNGIEFGIGLFQISIHRFKFYC